MREHQITIRGEVTLVEEVMYSIVTDNPSELTNETLLCLYKDTHPKKGKEVVSAVIKERIIERS